MTDTWGLIIGLGMLVAAVIAIIKIARKGPPPNDGYYN